MHSVEFSSLVADGSVPSGLDVTFLLTLATLIYNFLLTSKAVKVCFVDERIAGPAGRSRKTS